MARKPINLREQKDLEQWRGGAEVKPCAKGAPKGNSNRKTHGIFSNRLLNDEEGDLFKTVIARFRKHYDFSDDAIACQIELIGLYVLKLNRAIAQEKMETAETLDRMLRGHMKSIRNHLEEKRVKASSSEAKKKRPCDIISDLLQKMNNENALSD